jgi:hypothetical protein
MTLEQLKKSDLSEITYKSARDRLKELGRIRNASFSGTSKRKDSVLLKFKSPSTYLKDRYEIILEILKGNNIKVSCSCESFNKQGFQYRLTQKDASINPENREDKKWRKYHGNALLCKHLWILLNKQKKYIMELLKKYAL